MRYRLCHAHCRTLFRAPKAPYRRTTHLPQPKPCYNTRSSISYHNREFSVVTENFKKFFAIENYKKPVATELICLVHTRACRTQPGWVVRLANEPYRDTGNPITTQGWKNPVAIEESIWAVAHPISLHL